MNVTARTGCARAISPLPLSTVPGEHISLLWPFSKHIIAGAHVIEDGCSFSLLIPFQILIPLALRAFSSHLYLRFYPPRQVSISSCVSLKGNFSHFLFLSSPLFLYLTLPNTLISVRDKSADESLLAGVEKTIYYINIIYTCKMIGPS